MDNHLASGKVNESGRVLVNNMSGLTDDDFYKLYEKQQKAAAAASAASRGATTK